MKRSFSIQIQFCFCSLLVADRSCPPRVLTAGKHWQIMCYKERILYDRNPFLLLREGVKNQGGGRPPPAKNIELSKILSMLWKTFFIENNFLYCRPCRGTGSKEIYIKRGRKSKFFCFSPKAAGPESLVNYFQKGALLGQKVALNLWYVDTRPNLQKLFPSIWRSVIFGLYIFF